MTAGPRQCVAIVAHFAWWSQQCQEAATTIYYPPKNEYPGGLPVCAEHNPDGKTT